MKKNRNNSLKLVRLAIVGYGYWGPNVFRNFNELNKVLITYCCDLDTEKLKIVKRYKLKSTLRLQYINKTHFYSESFLAPKTNP